MKRISLALAAAAVGLTGMAMQPAWSANVKITPLGSHDGEFCRNDRAMIFEDPDGTRILYDASRTVAGPDDPRLGKIDLVLLSSVHGDHIGDRRIPNVGAGTCAKPKTSVKMTPNTNTGEIIAKKGAVSYAGGEMFYFLKAKVKAAGGNPKLVNVLRFGGERKIGGLRNQAAAGGPCPGDF